MSTHMIITISVLFVTAVLFVWGKIRADIVALCSLLVLVLTNVITTNEALAGFSNPIVIMIPALFIIGGAISQTGLAGSLSNTLLKLAGNSSYKLFILVILVTALIGSFLSNTGTVSGHADAYRGKSCCESPVERAAVAHTYGLCQQYWRNDDVDRYRSYTGHT